MAPSDQSSRDRDPLEAEGFAGFLWAHRRLLAGYLAFRLLSVLAVVPFPVITQRVIDAGIPSGDWGRVLPYSAAAAGFLLLHFASMRLAVGRLSHNGQLIIRILRARIFQKLQFMHFGFLDTTQTGRLLSKYAFDTNNVEFAMLPLITVVIPEIVRSLALIAALAVVNPWLLVFVAVSLPVFALVRWRFFGPIQAVNTSVRKAREQLTGQATEFISAIKLVRGFGQERPVVERMDAASDLYSERRRDQMLLNHTLGYTVFSLFSAIEIATVAGGALLVIRGDLTLGALVALIGALPVILNPVNLITQFSPQFLQGAESYRSIKELVDSGYVEKWHGSRTLPDLRGDLRLAAVRFRYNPVGDWALDGLSLDIRAGERIALVGPSGSGKSTVVNLVLGLYAPDEGVICIDGCPQHELAMGWFRRQCAIVMQDNVLLSGSIRDNIRFGKPEASEDEVRAAADAANVTEFIDTLPDGFETRVGERGVALSGGQRQRVAIARAILRDPRILILDEATSALDTESERLVREAIDRLTRGRTTLTIAHRLGTVRNADRIVVMRGGTIIESGRWEDLERRENGIFRRMLTSF